MIAALRRKDECWPVGSAKRLSPVTLKQPPLAVADAGRRELPEPHPEPHLQGGTGPLTLGRSVEPAAWQARRSLTPWGTLEMARDLALSSGEA